jgi:hypothetical protein
MKLERTTFVEFLRPGSLFVEAFTQRVTTRDVSKLTVPKAAYGFTFYDILSTSVWNDGVEVPLHSKRVNVSPMHYYGGKVFTIAEIKREFSRERTLIRNFVGNNYTKAILTRTGNWCPLFDDDILIPAK